MTEKKRGNGLRNDSSSGLKPVSKDEVWVRDRKKERRQEWEKIKSLGWKARLGYFWDYYKIVLIFAAAVLILISVVRTMIRGAMTDRILQVTLLNTDTLNTDTDALRGGFIKQIGGLKKNQDITFDSSITINTDAKSQMDLAADMKLTIYAQAQELDVVLGPAAVMDYVQQEGMFLDLTKVFSSKQLENLEKAGDLYYDAEPVIETEKDGTTPVPQADTDMEYLDSEPGEGKKPWAVRVDNGPVLDGYVIYGDEPVYAAVIANTQHKEMSVRFLNYLKG